MSTIFIIFNYFINKILLYQSFKHNWYKHNFTIYLQSLWYTLYYENSQYGFIIIM